MVIVICLSIFGFEMFHALRLLKRVGGSYDLEDFIGRATPQDIYQIQRHSVMSILSFGIATISSVMKW